MDMSLTTIKVNYPRGFLDKINQTGNGIRNNGFTKDQCAKWGVKEERQKLVTENSIILPFVTLISTFNTINNTYKINPEKILELNNIAELITSEDSLVKHVLTKLNGTHGRSLIIKNDKSIIFPTITYIPVLKETKQYLLILFNRFLKCKKEDKDNEKDNKMIMYEGRELFIYLFAIIIDTFYIPNPLVQIKKDCTDIFSMITLLELLLKKKYKNIINLHINNIPIPLLEIEEIEEIEEVNNGDDSDDKWDKEDFDIVKTTDIITKTIIEDKNEDKINDIDDIEIINEISGDIPGDIPDNWDSL